MIHGFRIYFFNRFIEENMMDFPAKFLRRMYDHEFLNSERTIGIENPESIPRMSRREIFRSTDE